MKKIQRIITLMIWLCSIAITAFALITGFPPDLTKNLIIAMFSVSMVATVIYFIPIWERLKAILVLLLVGGATLATSVVLGGVSGTFFVSFIVLGMAVLYFDPVVLIGYSGIYLTLCVIAYMVNPTYIVGAAISVNMSFLLIMAYAIMTVALYIGTRNGNRIMNETAQGEAKAQENAATIEAQSKAVEEDTIILSQTIGTSNDMVNELTKKAAQVNEQFAMLKDLESETVNLFSDLKVAITSSSKQIEDNYQIIEQLEQNFQVTISNVTESKEYSDNAKRSLNDLLTTIESAFECIARSSKETKEIQKIIDDIDAIASQTNLLAINAAIEAARVGHKGAGFDIVADEIRTLSVQSKESGQNIRHILEALTNSLEITEAKVNKGIQAIKSGVINLNHMANGIDIIDQYSAQSQSTLVQEIEVFETIKEEFADMVKEVEGSTAATKQNMEDMKLVAESIASQYQRTIKVSECIEQMKELNEKLGNGSEEKHVL